MSIQTMSGADAASVTDDTSWGPKRRFSEAHIAEAQNLMGRAFAGNRRAMTHLGEALASSDFRAAAFDILDREMIAAYDDITPVWTQYVATTTVRDFKPKRLVDLLGGKAALDRVPELTEYPARDVSKALYRISVSKYGGRFAISWEAFVNDELGELQDLPGHLATAARDTESIVAASLLTDGNGPNDAYFNATAWGRKYDEGTDTWSGGSSNLLTGNPVLSIESLQLALDTIKARKDPQGRPIQVPRFKLVVPQALEMTAQRVLNTLELRVTVGDTQRIERNYVAGSVELVVDPWLDVLDKGTNAAKTWYVVASPQSSRKPFYLARLRGHETPDLRTKADTGQRVGGGSIVPEEGSFDVDDVQYRVRHVVGGTGTDLIGTVASTGAGS